MEYRLFNTLALLVAIVVEQAEGIASQEHDGYEVAGREEGHEEVNDIPYQFETGQSTEYDHHACREQTVCCHHFRVRGDETDIGFTVIVVANDT